MRQWIAFSRHDVDAPAAMVAEIATRPGSAWMAIEPVYAAPGRHRRFRRRPQPEAYRVTLSTPARPAPAHLVLEARWPKGRRLSERAPELPARVVVVSDGADGAVLEVPADLARGDVVRIVLRILDAVSDQTLGDGWRANLSDTSTPPPDLSHTRR